MEKVTFVLVTHNGLPHVQATVNSLFTSTNYPFKLIIVESESTDGTTEYVNYLEKSSPNVTVLHTKKEGTIKAFNAGIRASDADSYIFLCHDDVFFFRWYGRDWLRTFMSFFEYEDDIGIIIPVNGGGTSGDDYADGFNWAGTWSTLIKKDVVNLLGRDMFFDEEYGKGYGDDIDMSFRVVASGYRIIMTWFWIDHHRLTEHYNNDDIEVEEIKKRNSAYFKRKFGIGEHNG